jgi:hypothetical protein
MLTSTLQQRIFIITHIQHLFLRCVGNTTLPKIREADPGGLGACPQENYLPSSKTREISYIICYFFIFRMGLKRGESLNIKSKVKWAEIRFKEWKVCLEAKQWRYLEGRLIV